MEMGHIGIISKNNFKFKHNISDSDTDVQNMSYGSYSPSSSGEKLTVFSLREKNIL